MYGGLIVPRKYARPMVPASISDAVSQWARQWGRSVRWEWVEHPGLKCWAINLSPLPDDPKKLAVQEGRWAPQDADEHVLLVDGGQAMNLEDYGAEGVVRWLERGNMRSGRGEVNSLEEQVRKSKREHRARAEQTRRQSREWANDLVADTRRQRHKIPFLPVGIDLNPGRSRRSAGAATDKGE